MVPRSLCFQFIATLLLLQNNAALSFSPAPVVQRVGSRASICERIQTIKIQAAEPAQASCNAETSKNRPQTQLQVQAPWVGAFIGAALLAMAPSSVRAGPTGVDQLYGPPPTATKVEEAKPASKASPANSGLVVPAKVDMAKGSKLFEANCAACHVGGGNVIGYARGKTLLSDALIKNGYTNQKDIVQLLQDGKGVMPRYSEYENKKGKTIEAKLTTDEMETVAGFVLKQAENGWN
eukprot:CAMPEP_0113936080 /NCGR_PEP_ID=MMETSP1339-20121228/3066_1 /TAXON_ID=94617 /ORGANISM="Fibrocapsa japonica" /LENGTH=235 /DNA_ID=CAMNT_0000938419 /DNA_START=58 /DNA_END=765 /DNA_ORIENTATION=+ /assembly_acc=CAM_ASM_000762